MNTQPAAAALTAAALLIYPDGRAAARLAALKPKPRTQRHRLPALAALAATAIPIAAGTPTLAIPAAAAAWWFVRRATTPPTPKADPFRPAIPWELLAAALRAGLPVATAVQAVTTDLPGPPGQALRATADLLAIPWELLAAALRAG